MSNTLIRQAFETRLAAWAAAQVPPIPIAYENQTFVPPTNARYARCFVIPAPTESDTLDRLHRRYTGIFQVTLCLLPNTGSAEAAALADSLDAYFPANTQLVQGAVRITLLSPLSLAQAIPGGSISESPVSAFYRADTI